MAQKNPLVLDANGDIEEIQSGDTFDDPSPDTLELEADVSLALGDWVYSSSTGNVDKAKADAAATLPCIGVCLDTISAAGTGTIQVDGLVTIAGASFTPGSKYYLSSATAGAISTSEPTTSGHYVQRVGVAKSATEIMLDFGQTIKRG